MDTLDWENGYEAVTTARIELSDTYIPVTPVPNVSKGRLVLEDNSSSNYEIIKFTSKDANGVFTTSGGARNEDGNSTGVHAKGVRVRMNITAQDLQEIRDYADTVISAYSAMPTGSLIPFAGSSAPASWLLADGSAVDRTTYAALFAVIGTSYGIGNGTTTFNLPNMKGRSAFGYDSTASEFNALGKTGGQKTVGAHAHHVTMFMPGSGTIAGYNDRNGDALVGTDIAVHGGNGEYYGGSAGSPWGDGSSKGVLQTDPTGKMSGTNNLNPYVTTNFIIKI